MNEQERQAVEKAANEHADEFWGENYITENKNYNVAGFIAGAEFALTELRKPSENLVNDIDMILECESEKSICVECDSFHSFPSLQPHSFNAVAAKIASLAPFNPNAETLEALDALYESLPDGYTHDCLIRVKAVLHPIYAERNHQRCGELKNDEF